MGSWKVYASAIPKLSDLITDSLKCAIFTDAYVPAITDDSYTALSGELANGNGYATGGVTLAGVTFTETAGVWKLACTNFTAVTASGADLTCRSLVVYNDTDAGKQLVAMRYLNDAVNVVIPDGTPLDIQNPNGIFVTGGW